MPTVKKSTVRRPTRHNAKTTHRLVRNHSAGVILPIATTSHFHILEGRFILAAAHTAFHFATLRVGESEQHSGGDHHCGREGGEDPEVAWVWTYYEAKFGLNRQRWKQFQFDALVVK